MLNLKNWKFQCPNNSFLCDMDDICISIIQVCDGINDCSYNEDERNCSNSNVPDFYCLDSFKKINYLQVCDFVSDCSDSSDENYCGK